VIEETQGVGAKKAISKQSHGVHRDHGEHWNVYLHKKIQYFDLRSAQESKFKNPNSKIDSRLMKKGKNQISVNQQ